MLFPLLPNSQSHRSAAQESGFRIHTLPVRSRQPHVIFKLLPCPKLCMLLHMYPNHGAPASPEFQPRKFNVRMEHRHETHASLTSPHADDPRAEGRVLNNGTAISCPTSHPCRAISSHPPPLSESRVAGDDSERCGLPTPTPTPTLTLTLRRPSARQNRETGREEKK